MSTEKEKHIGTSHIIGNPYERLVFKQKEGSICKKHLSQDLQHEVDRIDDLQNQIDSIQIGGWAISQEFGNDEHIGISQKALTEFRDEEIQKDTEQDETLGEHTAELANHETELENRYTKNETYSKEQLNSLITTPEQEYENYTATSETTSIASLLPEEGEADTTYRVGCWNGTEYDVTKFSEYGWDGTQYILLNVQAPGIDEEPTAESDNLVKSGGVALAMQHQYDAHSLSDDADFNKYIRYIIHPNYAVVSPIRGNIADYKEQTNKWVNTLYDAQDSEILVERFDTKEEALNSIINNPDKVYNQYRIGFNAIAVQDTVSFSNVNLLISSISPNMRFIAGLYDDIPTLGSKNLVTSDAVAKVRISNFSSQILQIEDNTSDNFAPAQVLSANRSLAHLIIFKKTITEVSIYKYVGNSVDDAYWLSPQRWVAVGITEGYMTRTSDVGESGQIGGGSAYPSTSYEEGSILNVRLTAEGGCNTFITPLSSIKIDSYFLQAMPIVDMDGNGLTRFSTLNPNKYYRFLSDGSQLVLLNKDTEKDYVRTNANGYNLYDAGELVVGYIDADGENGYINTRIRTNASVFYKCPMKLYVKNGYFLYRVYKYTEDTVSYETYNKTGIVEIHQDGLCRFVFSKIGSGTFESTEDVCDILPANDRHEVLSLANVEHVLTIGTSHTQGHGVIKNKSFVSYLSALYDWNFFNLGVDGCNYTLALEYILNDTALTSGAKYSDKPNNSGVCLDFLAGSAEYPYYYADGGGNNMEINIRRLYSVLRSQGYEIIPSSYFGDNNNAIAKVQNKIAKELGLQFVSINKECQRIGGDKSFTPYYYAGHFASRTDAMQFYTFWKYAKLRRPRTAIKIFRNRNTVSDISDLLYNDTFERLKLWDEISVNHKALRETEYNYVDRLDAYYAAGKRDIPIASEYTALSKFTAKEFQDKALIEIVFPSTATGLKDVKIHFTANKVLKAYLRKYTDPSSIIPTTPAQVLFRIVTSSSSAQAAGINIGDIFTCDAYESVTFTVTDLFQKYIYCDASDQITSFPGQTIAVLTRTSDSAVFNCNSINKGIPEDYQTRKNEPFGIWEEVTVSNGVINIDDMTPYMEYDKLSLLLYNEDGESFTLNRLFSDYEVLFEKEKNLFHNVSAVETKGVTTNILSDGFTLSGTTVGEYGTLVNGSTSFDWDGDETYTLNGETISKNHIPDYYKTVVGRSRILHLKQGAQVYYSISDFSTDIDVDDNKVFKVELVVRYFPASNLDTTAHTFTITENTFDFGRLGIKTSFNGSIGFSNVKYVPASWVIVEDEIIVDGLTEGYLILEAIDTDIEILDLRVNKIEQN